MSKSRKLKLDEAAAKELDKKIQEIAIADFELFCKMFNIDKAKAYVCFEIKKKKSLQQIGIRLGIGRQGVWAIAKNCEKE